VDVVDTANGAQEYSCGIRQVPTAQSLSSADDRAVQILLAEYEFVAGLIPFYRRAELTVLAATGALLSIVVAALATLEAAEDGQRHVEGMLLALGAWVPVLLLLIEVMALTRIKRASRYIYRCLHPMACELGRPGLLEFERAPGVELVAGTHRRSAPMGPGRLAAGDGHHRVRRAPRERLRVFFSSSTPLILAIAAASLGLAVGGMLVDWGALTLGFGLSACIGAIVLAWHGIASTQTHEGRGLAPHVDRDHR
jgi:hypothetical protein